MDAARTARRLTAGQVTVLYRRTRAEMPAEPEEIEELLAEGCALQELVSPRRALREDGRLVGLECVRNELGEPDADGRRRPRPVPGSEFVLPADALIVAIGQAPAAPFLRRSGVAVRADGTIVVDESNGRCNLPGVYAGGDVVRGPETIIAACADGRRAAEAICRQLGVPFATVPHDLPALDEQEIARIKDRRARQEPQHRPERLPAAQRLDFALVEGTLSEEAARREAERCLQCSTLCDKCVEVCPNRANQTYLVPAVHWSLPVLTCSGGRIAVAGEEDFVVKQTRQIVHLADLCNECGNCATFCLHQGRPYTDKPRLFLHEEDFRQAHDNAFLVNGKTIRRREGGLESWLTLSDEGLLFADAFVHLRLSPDWRILDGALKEPFSGHRSLRPAAEMLLLMQGLAASLPFLEVIP